MKEGTLKQPHFSRVESTSGELKLMNCLVSLFFVIFLVLPLLAWSFSWSLGVELVEKRELAAAPIFSWENREKIPKEIDAYFKDHFGFREILVHADKFIRHILLGASSDIVLIGKEDWLFYSNNRLIDDYLGQAPFSDKELLSWKTILEHRQTKLEQKGIKFLFVVIPDKNNIYPEMLPDYLTRRRGKNRLDQFVDYLKQSGSKLNFLDLRTDLIAAKSHGLLYYPHDTHWNGLGYYYGYQAIIKQLNNWFPDIQPLRLDEKLTLVKLKRKDGNWSALGLPERNLRYPSVYLGRAGEWNSVSVPVKLPSNFAQEWKQEYTPIKTENSSAQHRLVFFHDSFMRYPLVDGSMPLSENFQSMLSIWTYGSEDQIETIAESEKPDVIVQQFVQRFFVGSP